MTIPGGLLTTAMGVLPHTDVGQALKLALGVDIPFWPQLPRYSYYEDMYVQASEHFPGIVLDLKKKRLAFSKEKFMQELETVLEHWDEPAYFDISDTYSVVYHRFLSLELAARPAIRGQIEGPVSFGLNVHDQDDRPILFDDELRPFLFDFMAKRVNVQLNRMKNLNPRAFMFVDEPGLQYLFSALSGYDSMAAHKEMEAFLAQIERPRGIHLCGNPDWDFLLSLEMDILSLDVYSNGPIFSNYAPAIKKFLDRGGVLVYGLVPTNFEPFARESVSSMERALEHLWSELSARGIDKEVLLSRGLLSPATCCLVNPDGDKTVERAYAMVQQLSRLFQEKYHLI